MYAKDLGRSFHKLEIMNHIFIQKEYFSRYKPALKGILMYIQKQKQQQQKQFADQMDTALVSCFVLPCSPNPILLDMRKLFPQSGGQRRKIPGEKCC